MNTTQIEQLQRKNKESCKSLFEAISLGKYNSKLQLYHNGKGSHSSLIGSLLSIIATLVFLALALLILAVQLNKKDYYTEETILTFDQSPVSTWNVGRFLKSGMLLPHLQFTTNEAFHNVLYKCQDYSVKIVAGDLPMIEIGRFQDAPVVNVKNMLTCEYSFFDIYSKNQSEIFKGNEQLLLQNAFKQYTGLQNDSHSFYFTLEVAIVTPFNLLDIMELNANIEVELIHTRSTVTQQGIIELKKRNEGPNNQYRYCNFETGIIQYEETSLFGNTDSQQIYLSSEGNSARLNTLQTRTIDESLNPDTFIVHFSFRDFQNFQRYHSFTLLGAFSQICGVFAIFYAVSALLQWYHQTRFERMLQTEMSKIDPEANRQSNDFEEGVRPLQREMKQVFSFESILKLKQSQQSLTEANEQLKFDVSNLQQQNNALSLSNQKSQRDFAEIKSLLEDLIKKDN